MELISQSIHLAEVEDTQAALVALLSEVCRDEGIVKVSFVCHLKFFSFFSLQKCRHELNMSAATVGGGNQKNYKL